MQIAEIDNYNKLAELLHNRGRLICLKIETNQKVLDKRLCNADIPYSVYREKTNWNNELAQFMTVLNNYREAADIIITGCACNEMF